MIIFGIDPSLNSCGYCLISVENNQIRAIFNGTIKHKKDAEFLDKLKEIYTIIAEKIKEKSIDYLAIEETFVNSNPRTSLKLGMVRGICVAAGINCNISTKNIREYEPRLIKKTITGNGAADKTQVDYMIKKMISNFAPGSDDESDAAGVAITCYMLENSPLAKYGK